MVYSNLGFIFIAVAIDSFGYDNIVLTEIIADIWGHGLKNSNEMTNKSVFRL